MVVNHVIKLDESIVHCAVTLQLLSWDWKVNSMLLSPTLHAFKQHIGFNKV